MASHYGYACAVRECASGMRRSHTDIIDGERIRGRYAAIEAAGVDAAAVVDSWMNDILLHLALRDR